MTDAELLHIVQAKSPDQLTLRELDWLRQRLLASEELREELLVRRQMREYLTEALARLDISLDQLLAAAPLRSAGGGGRRKLIVGVVCLLLLAVGVAIWRQPWRTQTATLPAADAPAPDNASAERSKSSQQNASAAEALASSAKGRAEEKAADIGSQPAPDPGQAPENPGADRPAKTAATPPASGPWDAALRADVPPAAFTGVAFRPFLTSKTTPGKDVLAEWFTPMNAHAQIGKRRVAAGTCGSLQGVFRLKAPLREGVALRFGLQEYDRLKIHCFVGDHGVTCAFYQAMNFAWTAYQTHRQPGSPQPDRYVLAATDGGRGMRTESRYGGPYELRWQSGELILSRGDVPLLRAPMPESPAEVFFDGPATFTGLTLVKSENFPLDPLPPADDGQLIQPATLEWKEQLTEGAAFQKHADGSVELTANTAKGRGWVTAPLPRVGIQEVVLKIETASPGVGVFLGRGPEGKPQEVVKFLNDQRTGHLGISLHGDDDVYERPFEPADQRTSPLIPQPVWLRMLFGCGILRCWTSVDGIHWAEPFFDPRTNLPGEASHLGLHYVINRPDCRLRVADIRLRTLPAFQSLVEAGLAEQALSLPQAADYGDWLAKVSAAQPAEADTRAWRRACAVKTLGDGCPLALGDALVNSLLDDAQDLPLERQFALLDEAALVLDLRSDANRLTTYLARYRELAERANRADGAPPFSLVRRPMMLAPVASPHQYRLGAEKLIRTELLELLDQGKSRETLALCELLQFYRLDENMPLIAWARAAAQRQAPEQSVETLVEQRDVWRHPLVEELSKDAYNFLAEFQALLDSEAFDEAARMIAATEPHAAAGVAADRRDPRLLVSLPAAIRLALRDWPELRAVIEDRYADLAQLRVRRAMNQGDETGVRSTALQFDATPAAALAARWLGDRALSRGYFEQSLALYERAARTADAALLAELAPRQRLAGAMLGRDLGSAVSSSVELGDVQIPAEEFETMVTQMRERAAATPSAVVFGAAESPRIHAAPAPRGFTAQSVARLDGPAGDRPNELTRHVREGNIDWVAHQLGWVIEGDTLYVSNRFHLAAYDLASGQRRWQSPAPPGKPGRAHDWSLAPMRPLVTEKHVLARQLTGDGPILTCLDKQSGQVVWTSQPPPGEWLASDPLVVQGRLLLLRVRPTGTREATLVLCDYDSATGEPRDQQELLQLREPAWAARRVCQAAVVDDALVAMLGGCVVCADLTGGVRWVRKQVYVPLDEEPSWGGQAHDLPLAHGDRVYLAQPGVRSIECVDIETGRSHWTRTVSDVQRLIGLVEGRLIVETTDAFLALNPEDGATLWRHEVAETLDGRLCDGPGKIVYVRQTPGERDDTAPRPQLVWLDPQSGREQASFTLNDLARKEIRLGPLLAHADRLWAFVGAGPQDPNRELVQLLPQGEATPPVAIDGDPWLRHIPPSFQAAAARVLADWQPFRGIAEKQAGYYAELHGERDVLSLDGSRGQPVVFARRVTIPATGRAKLRLRLAMETLQASKLQVEFRGQSIWEQTLDNQTLGSKQWRDFEADLSSCAGQNGWLTVRLAPDNDQRFTSLWKRLEVAF